MANVRSLALFRGSVVVFLALSLVLTAFAIAEQVPYRLGGFGAREDVASDAFVKGTGISPPLVFLIIFAVLLALTWLPARWKALPLFLASILGAIGLAAGVAEIPLGSGPFAYPIGLLAVALWFVNVAATATIVIAGVLAGLSVLREPIRGPG